MSLFQTFFLFLPLALLGCGSDTDCNLESGKFKDKVFDVTYAQHAHGLLVEASFPSRCGDDREIPIYGSNDAVQRKILRAWDKDRSVERKIEVRVSGTLFKESGGLYIVADRFESLPSNSK